jgi:hypothetical protein
MKKKKLNIFRIQAWSLELDACALNAGQASCKKPGGAQKCQFAYLHAGATRQPTRRPPPSVTSSNAGANEQAPLFPQIKEADERRARAGSPWAVSCGSDETSGPASMAPENGIADAG